MSAVVESYLLTAADRCDRCGSQAFVEVLLSISKRLKRGGILQLCAHHADQYLDDIKPLASTIFDERYRLAEAIKDDKHV